MKTMQALSRPVVFFSLALMLSCSGSGTGGDPSALSATVRLSGTVAAAAPIANTAISLRDSTGKIVSLTTSATGTFDANVALTLPVVTRAPNPETGQFIYSYTDTAGNTNIHPLTDAILRIWYAVKRPGGNIDDDFINSAPSTLPTASEVSFIKAMLERVILDYLSAAGISPGSFDLITSPFASDGTGFDKVLKGIRISVTGTGAVNIIVLPGSALESVVKSGGYSLYAFLNASIVSLATDTMPPAAPTSLGAAKQCGKSVVTWSTSTSTDVASYQVFEDTRGQIATVTYTAFVDANVLSSSTYTYSVRAIDAAGNASPYSNSNSVSFDAGGCSVFFTPAALSSAPSVTALSSSQLKLDWSAIPESGQINLKEYRVYSVGTTSTLRATTVATTGAQVMTFTDFQLDPGTQYCYTVTLVSPGGLPPESAPSPTACGTTLPGVPLAPKNVLAVPGAGSMTVNWSAVGSAVFYKVYVASAPGITKQNYGSLVDGKLYPAVGTSQVVTGLTPGRTYYAVVTAVNASGESAESVQVQATPAP